MPRRIDRCLAALFAGAAVAALAAPSALATGGARMPGAPQVSELRCTASAASPCPARGAVAPGGELTITGSDLDGVDQVVFRGGRGSSDDATVRPRHARAGHLETLVPAEARSGPIAFVTKLGETTASERRVVIRSLPARDLSPGRGYFLGGRRAPAFTVPPSATGTRLELVGEADGTAARAWQIAPSNQPTTVRWDGMLDDGAALSGRYRFRLAADGSDDETGAAATAPATERARPFDFYDHVFPIRGKHDLGQSETNNFGGGRGHQGQDMFAACGTPLAAAQGGVVKKAGNEGAMGNYVVITGRGGADYVYMHMNALPLVTSGERVFTGQAIGAVGDTGRASGCHLHFELWRAPGWWSGGRPFDAIALLRSWDDYS